MSIPYTFATAGAGNPAPAPGITPTPASQLDANFAALALLDLSNATFLQSGTGAVARTSNGKTAEMVSFYDFGAVGNGTTDDTAACQAAITWAETAGYRLIGAPGRFKLTSALQVTNGLNLIGSGISDTIFLPSASINAFNISTIEPVVFRDFQILYSTPGQAGTTGIMISAPTSENEQSIFDNIYIVSAYNGFNDGAAALWRINNCAINSVGSVSGGAAINVSNTFNVDSGDSKVTNCTLTGAAGMTAIKWTSAGGLDVIATKINGFATGISLSLSSGATADIQLIGCSIENATTGITSSKGGGTRLNNLIIGLCEIQGTFPIALTDTNTYLHNGGIIGCVIYCDTTNPGIEVDGWDNFVLGLNSFHSTPANGAGIKIGASAGPGAIGVNTYDANTTTPVQNASASVSVPLQALGTSLLVLNTYRCTTIQTANTNIVPASITGLSGPVSIGTYEFEANLFCTIASATAGLKITQLLTTAVLGVCNFESAAFLAAGVATQSTTTATSGTTLYSAANQPILLLIKGSFTVTTAGTFALQMCQAVSDASNSSVNVGSSMTLKRIA